MGRSRTPRRFAASSARRRARLALISTSISLIPPLTRRFGTRLE
jgi:hypothetical protein